MSATNFDLDLEDNGGLIRFGAYEEIEAWLGKERQALAWAADLPPKGNAHTAVFNRLRGLFKSTVRQLNEPRARGDQLSSAWPSISAAIKAAFGPLPHSQSVVGLLIEQIRQTKGEQAAIGALAIRLGVDEALSVSQLIGAFQILQHLSGVNAGTATIEKNSLAELRDRFRKAAKTADEETELLRQERGASTGQFDRWLEEQKGLFQEWRRSQEEKTSEATKRHQLERTEELKKFQAEHKTAIDELQAHIRAIKEEMKLRAPVEYWKKKALDHKKGALRFAIAGGATAVASLALIAVSAAFLLAGFAAGDSSTYWRVGGLATMVFVLLWVLRILVRLLLSDLHLLTDANERVALVQCYLALSAEGRIDDKDRALVLAPLFASTADGLVKDDAAPPSVLDVINKLIDKK